MRVRSNLYVPEDAFDGASENTWKVAGFGSAPSSVAVVYLMLDGDRPNLDTLVPPPRVGYEVYGVDDGSHPTEVKAAIAARLRYCRQHAHVIAGHHLHLVQAWDDTAPARGTVQVVDTSRGPGSTLEQRCESEGILAEHLGNDSPQAACTAALACALIATHELDICSWIPPLDLDALFPRSDIHQLQSR